MHQAIDAVYKRRFASFQHLSPNQHGPIGFQQPFCLISQKFDGFSKVIVQSKAVKVEFHVAILQVWAACLVVDGELKIL